MLVKIENDFFGHEIIEDGIKYMVYINKVGDIAWEVDGKLHRESDNPAVLSHIGKIVFYKNGIIHREDGPAIVYPKGIVSYYLYGKFYQTKGEWERAKVEKAERKESIVEMTVAEVCEALGKTVKIVKEK